MISVLNSFDRSKVSIATVNRDTFDFSYNFYPENLQGWPGWLFLILLLLFFPPHISSIVSSVSGYSFDLCWNYCYYYYTFDCHCCLCCFFFLLLLVLNYYCCLFLNLHVKFVILELNYKPRFLLNFVHVDIVWNDLALVKL